MAGASAAKCCPSPLHTRHRSGGATVVCPLCIKADTYGCPCTYIRLSTSWQTCVNGDCNDAAGGVPVPSTLHEMKTGP
jgi:hypothetical protein